MYVTTNSLYVFTCELIDVNEDNFLTETETFGDKQNSTNTCEKAIEKNSPDYIFVLEDFV